MSGTRCTGVILAGGEATRYDGRPKGLESVGGLRIIDRVAAALGEVTDDLLLIANQQLFVPDVVERTVSAVEGFVTDGSLSVDVIDAAEQRVATLRRSITG